MIVKMKPESLAMSQATLEMLITTAASHRIDVGPMGCPTYKRDKS